MDFTRKIKKTISPKNQNGEKYALQVVVFVFIISFFFDFVTASNPFTNGSGALVFTSTKATHSSFLAIMSISPNLHVKFLSRIIYPLFCKKRAASSSFTLPTKRLLIITLPFINLRLSLNVFCPYHLQIQAPEQPPHIIQVECNLLCQILIDFQ